VLQPGVVIALLLLLREQADRDTDAAAWQVIAMWQHGVDICAYGLHFVTIRDAAMCADGTASITHPFRSENVCMNPYQKVGAVGNCISVSYRMTVTETDQHFILVLPKTSVTSSPATGLDELAAMKHCVMQ
jgi:hypothetical protein